MNNPHVYEPGFTIEQHRDDLIDRLGKSIKIINEREQQLAAKDAVIAGLLDTLRNIATIARGYRPGDEVCDLISKTADAEVAALAAAALPEQGETDGR
jgi:hypothetical protein